MMLTFSTKYSRVPDDTLKMSRYRAMREHGHEPVEIRPAGVQVIREAFIKKEVDLGCEIVNMAILPDHVHINLSRPDEHIDIPKMVQGFKGYSSFVYNRWLEHSGEAKEIALRGRGYAITHLGNQQHLDRAIVYVDTNHSKHVEQWGREKLERYMCESDTFSHP